MLSVCVDNTTRLGFLALQTTPYQSRCDLIAKMLGGVGTSFGIKNTIDAESLATKVSNVGHNVASVTL